MHADNTTAAYGVLRTLIRTTRAAHIATTILRAVWPATGALPLWETLRDSQGARTALAGINAGVVGLLLAALYDPVWTTAIHSRADFGLALASFILLAVWKTFPVFVVAFSAVGSWLLASG